MIPEYAKKQVLEGLNLAVQSLHTETDIRKSLRLLPKIAYALNGVIELSDDPTAKFISLVISQQFGLSRSTYDGRTSSWYEINSDNVRNFKSVLQEYVLRLCESIEKDDEHGVIEASKKFFMQYHTLSRGTSRDVKDGT